MNIREKLVGIVCDAIETDGCICHCNHPPCFEVERVVNALIAHGVTVQEWISVKDRLPEEGDYVLCVLKGINYGGKIQVCKFVPADKFKDKPYFKHFRNGFPSVTHWMPLPQPPKGE